ncbi:MAG: Lrp/AsnC ligand binding domain-containing protein, partial [Flavobacteriales bacterium]|nr:Lrp/AsnC ligand binding domain-containing protein [Flavobacteriales bacterium]
YGYGCAAKVHLEIKESIHIKSAIEKLIKVPEIDFMSLNSGIHNLEVNIICKDNNHLVRLIHQNINTLDGILESKTSIYLNDYKETHLSPDHTSWSNRNSNVILDKKDYKIIEYLKEDGRISFTEMAKKIGTSPSKIRQRYNNLVDNKALKIMGWVPPVKMGFNAYVSILASVRPKKKIREVISKLVEIEEVTFVATISGEYNLEICLLCNDTEHLENVLHNTLYQIEEIDETETTMIFRVLKWEGCTTYKPEMLSA